MIQIRKEDNQKKQKEKKLKIYKVNTHKKTVIALWVLLAVSFLFAVYKNFTAIDIHTVHETKVIEETILDTHKIENFVENFAEVYYSWEQSAASIDNRTNALKGYLTGELQALNVDTVRKDIPVSSALTDFQIWEITEEKEQHYQVTYMVEQRITEGESSKTVRSAYQVTVYVDGSGNLTIIQNPTITSVPVKSGYTPKAVQSDGTVDSITTEEINEFLTTFFKLYPTATAKELTYYVNEGVLKPVGKEYIFSELVNPVYNRNGNQVTASLAVKYLDNQTMTTQVSQFNLVLGKERGKLEDCEISYIKQKTHCISQKITMCLLILKFCSGHSPVLCFDFGYLFCCGGDYPYSFLTHTIKQCIKLSALCIFFRGFIRKKELVYRYIITCYKLIKKFVNSAVALYSQY